MKERLEQIKAEAVARIQEADVPEKLNDVRVKFLGKKGELTAVLKGMKDVAPEERPKVGQLVNDTRAAIEELLEESKTRMEKAIREEKLKADYKYKDLNYSVEQLQGMITIENPSGTSLMRMTATNSDAQLAADIANAAADAVAERISEVMVIDKPSSVEEAEKPNYPVSPNVKKNMIMGGLIGAVLAVGVFTLLFLLDDTIKSEEDVRRYLQLNTLASIPKEKKRRRASSEA